MRPWVVRVWLEDLRAPVGPPSLRRFANQADAVAWAAAELERLRVAEGHRLGGDGCLCYLARVRGPAQPPRTACLFSDWEPVEWDDESP
ncbi:MAG TPA: hypothetical protein VGM60_20070 [Pseudonocardia sp.]